jgi:hypothetical protein
MCVTCKALACFTVIAETSDCLRQITRRSHKSVSPLPNVAHLTWCVECVLVAKMPSLISNVTQALHGLTNAFNGQPHTCTRTTLVSTCTTNEIETRYISQSHSRPHHTRALNTRALTTWPFSVWLAPAAPSAPPPLPPPPSTAQLHYYAPLSVFLSRARAVLLITLHSRLLLRCDAAALATTCDAPKTEQKNDGKVNHVDLGRHNTQVRLQDRV